MGLLTTRKEMKGYGKKYEERISARSEKKSSQAYNRKNNTYVKRGEDGRFMDVKSGSPFKGVRKEK